jgi:hypothetical protein
MSKKLIAIDPQSTFSFVSSIQDGASEEDIVTFELKHLSAREESFLEDKLGHIRDGDFHINLGSQNRLALDIGLVEVHNFKDNKGNTVVVERKKEKVHIGFYPLKDEFLDRIPKVVRNEIAQAIMAGNKLEDQDLKN